MKIFKKWRKQAGTHFGLLSRWIRLFDKSLFRAFLKNMRPTLSNILPSNSNTQSRFARNQRKPKVLLEMEFVYVTIGNPAFCLALYLTRFIFNLLCKPLDWLLYDNGILHERDNWHTFSRRVTAIKKYVNKKFGCQHDRWSDSIFRTFLSTVSISKFFFKMTACQEFFWMIYELF